MDTPFDMIVAVVLIATIGSIVSLKIKQNARAGDNREAMDKTRKRVAELEERVRVLERIVTDGKGNLERELNALREERP